MDELTSLSLEDNNGHGIIIRNDIFKNNLLILKMI